MKVINLFGGPGTGKSTLAAELFAALKKQGINCELVTEFAKDLVWSNRNHELQDQIYIFGKMYHHLWRLQDRVEVAIVDSPLPLCIYYGNGRHEGFDMLVMSCFHEFENINYILERRGFKYQQEGRYQTEQEADQVHDEIKDLLDFYDITAEGVEVMGMSRVDVIMERLHHLWK